MAYHDKLGCLVKRLDCSVVVKVKSELDYSVVVKVESQGRFRIPVNVYVEDTFLTAEPYVTKLGIMMHHHALERLARRLVSCLQVQGHSMGSYNQMTVSTISTALRTFLQPNLIGWYIIISWSVLCNFFFFLSGHGEGSELY